MLSPKRLIEVARKWQKMATLGRKRISWITEDTFPQVNKRSKVVADKGHFMVYSSEGERFMVPLEFLNSWLFQELLRLSEEEFGFSGETPISLPCDAVLLEHVFSLMKRRGSIDAERETLISGFRRHCSISALHHAEHSQQLAVF